MSLRHGWDAKMNGLCVVVCDTCGVRADGFALPDDTLRELGWTVDASNVYRRRDVCAICTESAVT